MKKKSQSHNELCLGLYFYFLFNFYLAVEDITDSITLGLEE